MNAYLFFLSLTFLVSSASAVIAPKAPPTTVPHVRGHLLVRVDPNQIVPLGDMARLIGAERTESFNLVPGLDLYEFDKARSVEEVRQHFLRNSKVIYAEPDYIYHADFVPNDIQFSKQWALDNNGQTGGSQDADINAPQMWQIQKGSENVVIATIDTGIDYNHPDLIDNVWRNPGETPGNGKDDDNNGYIDDIHGINAILNNGNPMDDNVHGTHVAGTIGAKGDNNLGVVGVAQTVKIASCKFLSSSGSGSISDALKCMDYFAVLKAKGINIIATNNSWGGGSASQALLDAIKAHEKLGILFIAAAGNSGENNDTVDRYPCNYQVPNVIAVAATDNKDQLAVFSSYGKKTVHVAAPGVKILSTVLNRNYGELSGTSMATPHVAGLAAVIAAQYPSYNYQRIKNLIMTSGQIISSTRNSVISGRRIRGADNNGVGALTCENQILTKRFKPDATQIKHILGNELFLSATAINCAENLNSLKIYDQNGQQVILQDNGQNGDAAVGDGVASLMWKPNVAGTYALDFGNGDIVSVIVSSQSNHTPGSYRADDGVNYEYENVQGQRLNAGDDTLHWIKIPFAIHFANDSTGYEDLYVSSNGTISFSNSSQLGPFNKSIPISEAQTLFAAFWDDLIPAKTGSDIFASILGEAPHRRLIIEWWKFRHYGAVGQGTFQAILYEDSADVRVNYLSTNFNHSSFDYGKSATVGLQTNTKTALQYSFNEPRISSNKSILFRLE